MLLNHHTQLQSNDTNRRFIFKHYSISFPLIFQPARMRKKRNKSYCICGVVPTATSWCHLPYATGAAQYELALHWLCMLGTHQCQNQSRKMHPNSRRPRRPPTSTQMLGILVVAHCDPMMNLLRWLVVRCVGGNDPTHACMHIAHGLERHFKLAELQ